MSQIRPDALDRIAAQEESLRPLLHALTAEFDTKFEFECESGGCSYITAVFPVTDTDAVGVMFSDPEPGSVTMNVEGFGISAMHFCDLPDRPGGWSLGSDYANEDDFLLPERLVETNDAQAVIAAIRHVVEDATAVIKQRIQQR